MKTRLLSSVTFLVNLDGLTAVSWSMEWESDKVTFQAVGTVIGPRQFGTKEKNISKNPDEIFFFNLQLVYPQDV